ncbi:MAG: aminotransferase class V-fold PLP-dependent enzyme [Kofleriaceae bacterium]|nr:aminotransferase class V-fold PLP-dependent enzyme [Kofleriaceae bacterium]
MSEDELIRWRSEFPTLDASCHLISHSLGAMPREARAHATEFLDQWEQQSIESWGRWLPYVRELGDVIGGVLGVPAGSVILNQNCSTVQAILASCFDYRGDRKKIVYSALEFSTVHYVWSQQARRGAEVVVVPSDDGIHNPLERFLDQIDTRTLIVPLSHVLFRSSTLQDLETIVKHAHSVGAMVLADCYQSTGVVPLALGELGVDFACGGSVKWACGGPGCAYLYVRPDRLSELRPMDTGWFGHEKPFAFDMGEMKYAADVWRMAAGTPAIPALYTARAGWDILAQLDLHAVRAKSLRQTARMRELAQSRGFRINTPLEDAARAGTMCFDFDGSEGVAKALNQRKFFCDWRPACGIRASPHFYTTDAEIERFMDEVERLRLR